MAAEVLSRAPGVRVTVYDAMPTVGRKLLMAGRGGLNLTHSEPLEAFLGRYGERSQVLQPLIEMWSPEDVLQWCEGLGQETFVGSSGRVFPKAMKASRLLRAWLGRLDAQGVAFKTRHRWKGFDGARCLVFAVQDGEVTVEADATVLALGGASWRRLGSDGAWVGPLQKSGVEVAPLVPANMGVRVSWSDVFRKRFEGQPLKSIAVRHGDQLARGEALVTGEGIEGGAVYAVAASLRDELMRRRAAVLNVDLKPDVTHAALTQLLSKPRGKQSMATFLRKAARLSPIGVGLLQEVAFATGRPLNGLTPDELAAAIKAVEIPVTEASGMDRAISSAGGVRFDTVDARLMLRVRRGVFVAGEMLDWEAPTGGYLLQACFATGAAAGHGAQAWLSEQET